MANTPLTINELGNKFVDYRDPIWGDSYNWSWNRKSTEIKYLVIHHSVTAHEATPDDIALLHKARGWGGIGYHFVITKDGMVYYVGDVGTARANVADMNEQVIGICLIGDFTKHLPSDEQIISCHKLCKFFLFSAPSIPNVKGWDDVVGHKELQATQCPGTSWDKSQSGDMWWRIKTGTPYTPPEESQPDEKYHIMYQGSEVGTYETNPIDKIKDLENQVKALDEEVATARLEVNGLKDSLADQERDNKELSEQLLEARTERDKAVGETSTLKTRAEKSEKEVEILAERLDTLEEENKALKTSLSGARRLKLKDFTWLERFKSLFSGG